MCMCAHISTYQIPKRNWWVKGFSFVAAVCVHCFVAHNTYLDLQLFSSSFLKSSCAARILAIAQDLNAMAETADKPQAVSDEWLDNLSEAINTDMWITDSAGPYYSDRLVKKESPAKQPYLYGTTFAPLWTGLVPGSRLDELTATVEQQQEVKQNQVFYIAKNGKLNPDVVRATGELKTCTLKNPDNPGSCSGRYTSEAIPESAMIADSNFGIPTSLRATGNQWDFANAWAPIQLFAAQGFTSISKDDLASQVDSGWTNSVEIGFAGSGTIIEKYDSLNPVKDVQVTSGYSKPQVGFGWTNGVYLDAVMRKN